MSSHNPNLDALAESVVQTIQRALAPVLSDVTVLRTQVAGWEARWNDVGALRERVAVIEAKAQSSAEDEDDEQLAASLGDLLRKALDVAA